MPTNRTKRTRRRAIDNIPKDLWKLLRTGETTGPTANDCSELYNELLWFMSAKEALQWLEACLHTYLRALRAGLKGDPFIFRMIAWTRRQQTHKSYLNLFVENPNGYEDKDNH